MVLGGTGADAVNVGIGTTIPQANLDVNGTDISGNLTGTLRVGNLSYNTIHSRLVTQDAGTKILNSIAFSGSATDVLRGDGTFGPGGNSSLDFDWYRVGTTSSPTAMGQHLYTTGKVGIGSINPDEQLTVCGNIHATGYLFLGKGLRIENIYIPCPDYVFDKKYKLMSLNEVENYVTQNHHLPNVPSASDIQKNGLDVANMSFNQLEKLEELYLHVIELNKNVEKLQAANLELHAQMKQLDNK